MGKCRKSLLMLGMSMCLAASGGISALAAEPVVTALRTIDNAYYFITDKYNPEENIMPFKIGKNIMFGGYGYADGDFNVVLPINEDWGIAEEFVEGIALVRNSDKCMAIDRAGNKLFDLEYANEFDGVIGRFKNDPNGYVACTIKDNGSIYHPGNPVLVAYDRAGNRTDYPLDYDKVGKFIDGYANVYKVDERHEFYGSFNGGDVSAEITYTYKLVGSINSTGEFFNKTNPEDKSNDMIERYHLNNGYSLIQDKEGGWGGSTFKLVDSNGTEYGRYLDVQGVMNGNQFIARPYKTREEVAQYISQYGENRNGLTDYMYSGSEYSWCDLTPRTIYAVDSQ